jgi:RND family efflux transporter MFP subunit
MLRYALLFLILVPGLHAPELHAQEDDSIVRGPTRPQRMAALAPQSDGIVREIAIREGDAVHGGDVLLRLRDELVTARVGLARVAAEAEGELRQAQINHTEAAAVLARTQQAAARGGATEWEVRQARARFDVTRAAADTAEERRRIEQQRLGVETVALEQLLIRAPFDGVVTRMETVVGATLTRTDRPVTVADMSVLEAVLFMPASVWPRLRIGASYTLRLSDPVDQSVEARLRHVEPVMDAASGRFRAVFTIANPDGVLPAGLEAELDLRSLRP